tara:strand:+ start:77 stop:610 length:534 start_codon:yes stop_codon:yes gene_type:complete
MRFPPGLYKDFILKRCSFAETSSLLQVDRYSYDIISQLWDRKREILLLHFIERFPIAVGPRFVIDAESRLKIKLARGVVMCSPLRIGVSIFPCPYCEKWHITKKKEFFCSQSEQLLMTPAPYIRVQHLNERHFSQLSCSREKLSYLLHLRHDHKRCKHNYKKLKERDAEESQTIAFK